MYYIHDNSTYEAMLPYTRIYYFQKNGTATEPWPQGMRVIAGEAMFRNESSFKSHGISMHCDSLEATSRALPQGDEYPMCKGVTLNIHFPSCGWANRSLDSPDHFSHLTWARNEGGNIDVVGTRCPDTHPIHYPAIILNSVYYFDEVDGKPWRAGKNNWIMSNGDLTGLTFHADFVMGWNPHVIKGMTEQCSNPNSVHEHLEECAPLKPYVNFEAARQCAYQGQIPAEDIGLLRAIDKLPGCNPVWTKDMGPNKPKCDNPQPDPGFVTPNVYYGQGTEWRIPIWVPDVPNILDMLPDMDWPQWVGKWGVREKLKNGQEWPGNPDTVMKYADGSAYQNSSVIVPLDRSFGMSDETPFNDNLVGEDAVSSAVPTSSSATPSATSSDPPPKTPSATSSEDTATSSSAESSTSAKETLPGTGGNLAADPVLSTSTAPEADPTSSSETPPASSDGPGAASSDATSEVASSSAESSSSTSSDNASTASSSDTGSSTSVDAVSKIASSSTSDGSTDGSSASTSPKPGSTGQCRLKQARRFSARSRSRPGSRRLVRRKV